MSSSSNTVFNMLFRLSPVTLCLRRTLAGWMGFFFHSNPPSVCSRSSLFHFQFAPAAAEKINCMIFHFYITKRKKANHTCFAICDHFPPNSRGISLSFASSPQHAALATSGEPTYCPHGVLVSNPGFLT